MVAPPHSGDYEPHESVPHAHPRPRRARDDHAQRFLRIDPDSTGTSSLFRARESDRASISGCGAAHGESTCTRPSSPTLDHARAAMATRGDSLRSAADVATQALYMGRDKGAKNFRDWKRAVDMTLSRRDDDLLHLVTHGVRSALEERVLRGKLVTAGLKIQPNQINLAQNAEDKKEYKRIEKQELRAMLARAYRIVHASVGEHVTKMEIERLFGQVKDESEGDNAIPYPDGHQAYQHLINETSTKFDETCIEASFVKEVEKIDFLSRGAQSGSESHIHEYVEKLLLINHDLKGSCFEMPDKLLCFHVLHNVAKFNQHFVSGYKGQHAGDATWTDSFHKFWTKLRAAIRADGLSKDVLAHQNQQSSDILATTSSRDVKLENLEAQIALLVARLDNQPRPSHAVATVLATRSAPTPCQECGFPHFPHKIHGCIGKALAEGTISDSQAAKAFPAARDPVSAAHKARSATWRTTVTRRPSSPPRRCS